jgi:hypothetical protein
MDPVGPSEPLPDVWPPKLDKRQRLEVAQLGGAADRRARGGLCDQDHAQSLAELLAISHDPQVWGMILGTVLADIEDGLGDGLEPIVAWARQVGADEDVARQQLEWMRAQPRLTRRRD